MTKPKPPRRQFPEQVVFSPVAWLKLNYLCHKGDTEVGGWGISRSPQELLYIEDIAMVKQHNSSCMCSFDDGNSQEAPDDPKAYTTGRHVEHQCCDLHKTPEEVSRIWIHTHPGQSANPSSTDEDTISEFAAHSPWVMMLILSHTQEVYARLVISHGPGVAKSMDVAVDWQRMFDGYLPNLEALKPLWDVEYANNVNAKTYDSIINPWDEGGWPETRTRDWRREQAAKRDRYQHDREWQAYLEDNSQQQHLTSIAGETLEIRPQTEMFEEKIVQALGDYPYLDLVEKFDAGDSYLFETYLWEAEGLADVSEFHKLTRAQRNEIVHEFLLEESVTVGDGLLKP